MSFWVLLSELANCATLREFVFTLLSAVAISESSGLTGCANPASGDAIVAVSIVLLSAMAISRRVNRVRATKTPFM